MKKLTVIFLLLSLLIVGVAGVFVEERVDSIVVTGKYLQVEIGKDGNLSKVSHMLGRVYLFYVNDNDGFDVFDLNNQELSDGTPTFNILGKKDQKGEYENLNIIFEYPNGIKKTYLFDNNLNMVTKY
ncbi:MAG: hypothetical protein ABDH59_06540 [Fervidobacterium sp.]